MVDFALVKNPHSNYYTSRKKPVGLIVLHVTAGLQDLDMVGTDHSARKTNDYGASTNRAASWHVCVDSDSIEYALPDNYTAFHAAGYNGQSLGLEISNADARWDNKPKKWTEATLLNAARVCHAWEKKFNIPRRLLSRKQVDAGLKGYSYHSFLDPERRSDPGRTFPWDRFVVILASLDKGSAVPASSTTTSGDDFVMDAKTTEQVRAVFREELDVVLGERRPDRKDTDPAHISLSDVYTQQERFEAANSARLNALEEKTQARLDALEKSVQDKLRELQTFVDPSGG